MHAIIFDLDGTAIPSVIDGRPSPKLRETIKSNAANAYFCAATGRSWRHAAAPIKDLGLTQPCVISGGTQIISPQREIIMWQVTINEPDLHSIMHIAREHSKKIAVVKGLNVTEPIEPNANFKQVNTVYMFDLNVDEYRKINNFFSAIGTISVSPTKSWYHPNVIDLHITHRQATKEHAITKLLEFLSVPKPDSVGIGDGHNDIHLFNGVGLKVAMGNAEMELKKKADIVIGNFDQDGLAVFIENFFRNKEEQ